MGLDHWQGFIASDLVGNELNWLITRHILLAWVLALPAAGALGIVACIPIETVF